VNNIVAVASVASVAVVLSLVLRRRGSDAPTQGGFALPTQIDRADFRTPGDNGPDAPWIVVLFTSATCDACMDMVRKAEVLRSGDVAVVEAEYGARADIHRRYSIDAVPSIVVADRDGTVRAGFMGPVKAQDLWAAVAECRFPGSTPEHGLGSLDDGR
jgi:hypothetical protein